MFSTILKEVTGYFDKRALLSAFFPAMIFWGLTIIIVLLYWKGWTLVLETWNKTDIIGQLLLLLAFFVWIAFWTFLTLNFQPLLLRIYEGSWPIEFIVRLRKRYWQRRWDAMDQRDKDLETQESILREEQKEFQSLLSPIEAHDLQEQQRRIEPNDPIGGKIDADLSAIKQDLTILERNIAEIARVEEHLFPFLLRAEVKVPEAAPEPTQLSQLKIFICGQLGTLGKTTRKAWGLYLKCAPGRDLKHPPGKDEGQPWTRHREKLDQLTGSLVEIGESLLKNVQHKRLGLHHEMFLMLPPYRTEVVATGLGNVLRAAEERVRLRYNLDALLAWSRLEPLLPKEATESLQSARTSLDLMLTLSASLLLFGLPLSVWLMLQTTKWFFWWVPLTALVVALVARLRVAAIPAGIAFLVNLFMPVSNAGAQNFLRGSVVVLTAFAGLSLVSWVCYQNAVQSCLVYGEKIQSAFDLYRWKLLDELHLQLPPSLEEERLIWKEVDGLLYRGFIPSSDYYRYLADEKKTKAPVTTRESSVRLPVPATSLAAYHLIKEGDIVERDLPKADIPIDAVDSRDKLLNMRSLTALPAFKPVTLGVLMNKDLLDEHVAVGLQVNQADILGGKLASGDRVDIIITAYNVAPVKYENILILDVSVVDVATKSCRLTTVQPVVTVALSRAQQEDFIVRRRFGNVNLTRRI